MKTTSKIEEVRIGDKIFINIPIDMLVVPEYQREPRGLNKLRKAWNPLLLDPIKVSLRDGNFNISDGNHRVIVAAEKGMTHIVAQLLTNQTLESESELFSSQTDAIVKLGCEHKFHADFVGKKEYAVNLKNLLDKYNLTFFKEKGKIYVTGKDVIISEAKKNPDCKSLDFVFSFLKENNWLTETNTRCFESFIMDGLIYAYNTYNTRVHNLSFVLLRALNMSSRSYKTYIMKEYPALEKRKFIKVEMDKQIRGSEYNK
jgi:hypothetical protein